MTNKILRKLKFNLQKGGVSMDTTLSVLKEFDRMPENSDFPKPEFLERVVEQYGFLTFVVFVCPLTRSKYLATEQKELFMPIDEPENGFLFPRIPKLKLLVNALWKLGIPSKINFIVGDNSYEVYRGPIEGIVLDKKLMNDRRKVYVENLTVKLNKYFPQLIEVNSLGLMGVEMFSGDLAVPEEVLDYEIAFQTGTVFTKFYDREPPDYDTVKKIVIGKIKAYAEQGLLIDATDGILIGTEGADDINSWRQRTKMFKLAGAKFPVIYPYIRKEVLAESI